MNMELAFAKQLALKAGDMMLRYFDTDLERQIKDDKTIVTVTDEAINQLVIDEVEKSFPEHGVFGEEKSVKKQSDMVWVCDPIDGTVPYSRGLAVSVFSLALVKDGVPIVGVVYDPFMKRLYSAVKGQGAFLNDQKIHVSDRQLVRHSIVNVEWWADSAYDIDTLLHQLSVDTKTYILHLGCGVHAACMVASGQYEAAVTGVSQGKCTDVAAVKIIVEEAGVRVTDLFGNGQRYDGDVKGAIISNGVVHDELAERLKDV